MQLPCIAPRDQYDAPSFLTLLFLNISVQRLERTLVHGFNVLTNELGYNCGRIYRSLLLLSRKHACGSSRAQHAASLRPLMVHAADNACVCANDAGKGRFHSD